MGTTTLARAGLLALALAAAPAAAQDRPPEEDLFGAPPPKPAPPAPGRPADTDILAAAPAAPQLREDPLKLGGVLYLRANAYWSKGVPPADWELDSPNLLDLYLDVRPNDRVRAFALGRMLYDPTVDPAVANPLGGASKVTDVLLDQLWIRGDIERTVFVTAGKQHVKWGVGHFWNPTDYLHAQRLSPLAVFDARAGTTMLKLHLPWEKRGWNFYGMALLEGREAVNRLGKVGGAARAELVLGTAELGLDAVIQRGTDARFGVDLSAGIWELDVYAEASLRKGSDVPLWRARAQPDPLGPDPLHALYETYQPGFAPQVTGGVSWSWKYSDEDTLTLGGEYFYNGAGYADETLYPVALAGQVLEGRAYVTPFYLGKHYAGVYLLLPNPGSWNSTSFVVSTLGNLSDRSFLSRVDWNVTVLTYVRLEAYAAVHYGTAGGEFRFALDQPAIEYPNPAPPPPTLTYGPYRRPPPVLDLGLALRVSL